MEQDQLQRLAEEVSAAYLRYLKHKTGDDKVTYDGVTKRVVFEELALPSLAYLITTLKTHRNTRF